MMRGGNRKLKRRNRIYRRIAIAMTVALLAGQSHAFVLAEENTEDVPQTEFFSEEIGEDIPADGSADGGDTAQGDENSAADQDTGDDNTPADQEPGDNGNLDNDQNTENNPSDGGGEENTDGDADGQGQCICETACTEESVNADCPVCAGNYAACAQNAGAVNPSAEAVLPEIVPENTLDAEAGIATLADEGVEALAAGEEITYDGIKYVVTGDGEVKVWEQGANAVSGDIIIPESFEQAGVTYRVTSIGIGAFRSCYNLTNVQIPESVTSIEHSAFADCTCLISVEIPEGVTSIGGYTFHGCHALSSIKLPESVTRIEGETFGSCWGLESIEIPENVTSIGRRAFEDCRNLASVEMPESVMSIGETAFGGCVKLTGIKIPEGVTSIEQETFAVCNALSSIELPKSVTNIGERAFHVCSGLTSVIISENISIIDNWAFMNCEKLEELRIMVLSDGKFRFPEVGEDVFALTSSERYILFIDENGDELTGEPYYNAKAAFIKAAKNDGDLDNSKWYGWSLKESSGVENTYTVTINVKKDGGDWIGHDRIFALSQDNGSTVTENLYAVKAGTYALYDVTDADNKLDTGESVTVTDADVSAEVAYCTVTFCDYDAATGETAYGDDTDQRPQIVLRNAGRAVRPASDPSKAGHTFAKWVTEKEGDTEFAFASTPVTAPTRIYARWTENIVPALTYKVTIHVKKDDSDWDSHGRTFALFKDGGDFLTVPGQPAGSTYEISQVPDGTYSIYDTTGVQTGARYSRARDTGMDVRVSGADTDTEVNITVNGADAEETVNYYTVTFYDGADAYGAGTPQQPQTVLRGGTAKKPEDPEKAGWQFAGWKTADGGSIPYGFNDAVTDITGIYASWVEKTAEQIYITATAAEGGTIAPEGSIAVAKGGEQTFTITPDEGYRIKAVTVDGTDVTGRLSDTPARAQAGAKYYTFTNVTDNHAIHAAFERDGSTPGGGDNPNPGGDNPNPGGGGDNPKPGGGGGTGDNTKPGGGSGTGDSHASGGDSAEKGQEASGTETASIQAGSGAIGTFADANTASEGGTAGASGSAANGPASGSTTTDDSAVSALVQASAGTEPAAEGSEPKTGDAMHMEVYATIAMIAGLTYLILYFMEEGRGMTEREKDVFVAAFIRWGKKGGAFRKCCAMLAIFCLLAYYHAIGKHVGQNALHGKYLEQAL